MSYRFRFLKLPKEQVSLIQLCKDMKDFIQVAEKYNYSTDIVDIDDPTSLEVKLYSNFGKQIFDFGSEFDLANEILNNSSSLFCSEELIQHYEEYCPVICTKESFLMAIEHYRQNIIRYYKELLKSDSGFYKEYTPEEKYRIVLTDTLEDWENDWGLLPYDINLNRERITSSFKYEHQIFELVRLYKSFDFDKDCLIFFGW